MQENPMQLKINKQAKFPSSIQNECKKKKEKMRMKSLGYVKDSKKRVGKRRETVT